MKKLELKFATCVLCPHFQTYYAEGYDYTGYCDLSERDIQIDVFRYQMYIPEWCELEEDE